MNCTFIQTFNTTDYETIVAKSGDANLHKIYLVRAPNRNLLTTDSNTHSAQDKNHGHNTFRCTFNNNTCCIAETHRQRRLSSRWLLNHLVIAEWKPEPTTKPQVLRHSSWKCSSTSFRCRSNTYYIAGTHRHLPEVISWWLPTGMVRSYDRSVGEEWWELRMQG